ncbi:MAG: 5'-methylthioadenosine/S-adenosylhomocysteine nucleosidase [Hyphomicrobium sp.]|jgi:nucleoside phosphorylase
MSIVDFGIITALQEEFEVLRRLLPQLKELPGSGLWYRGQVRANNGAEYSVVASVQDQMGPLDASDLTTRLIDRWDPAYLLLVGIAGSFAKDVNLADVLVSQQVFYYDPGKAVGSAIRYRPQGYPASVALTRQLEAIRLDSAALKRFRGDARKSAATLAREAQRQKGGNRAARTLLAHDPEVHFGTVASGSLVIASARKRKDLLRLHGKILGTEMEGAGMMHAAYYHREVPTQAIVIKGVSDPSNRTKDSLDRLGHWRTLAKENPVRLALAMLRRGRLRALQTDQYGIDVAIGSPVSARGVFGQVSPGMALLAFPRLIVPRGPLTRLQLEVDVQGKNGPVEILQRAVQYRTPDGLRRSEATLVPPDDRARPETIEPSPVALYLMLRETPTSVRFTVETPASRQSAEWKPGLGA